jgi:hypothetical protein
MKLIAAFNPTMIVAGNNLRAAATLDPETGEIPRHPSSDPRTVSLLLALGFDLLDDLSRQVADAATDDECARRKPKRGRPVGFSVFD